MTETLDRTCDPATATTRALLGWGVVAGPAYVLVSLAQALTRDGFDLGRHPWSALENGPWGWVQSTNFVLTGLMVAAFAAGLRRATGATGAARLLALYGGCLVVAGVFRADPVPGFPAGTTTATVSGPGLVHLAAGAVGFTAMAVGCLLLARHLTRSGRRGWALSARAVGIGFLAAFAGITTGAPAAVLPFAAAVVLSFGWLAALAGHLYRTV